MKGLLGGLAYGLLACVAGLVALMLAVPNADRLPTPAEPSVGGDLAQLPAQTPGTEAAQTPGTEAASQEDGSRRQAEPPSVVNALAPDAAPGGVPVPLPGGVQSVGPDAALPPAFGDAPVWGADTAPGLNAPNTPDPSSDGQARATEAPFRRPAVEPVQQPPDAEAPVAVLAPTARVPVDSEGPPSSIAPQTVPDFAAAARTEREAVTLRLPTLPGTPISPRPPSRLAPPPDAPPRQDALAALARPETTVPAGRLSIGRPARSLLDPAPAAQAPEIAASADAPAPALQANAAPVAEPDERPRVSFILIDDGSYAANPQTLQGLPFAISFAVDAALPDTAERVAAYRAAGFEVLAILDLPSRATPSDVETSLAFTLRAVDQAVGILEGPGAGLEMSRESVDYLISALRDTGHGLVLQPGSRGALRRRASRLGVPTRQVFRDFDADQTDDRVVRRFLDQAAFRARQEDGVIMLGRIAPTTLRALSDWGQRRRAQQVAISPVSAVLSEENLGQ